MNIKHYFRESFMNNSYKLYYSVYDYKPYNSMHTFK